MIFYGEHGSVLIERAFRIRNVKYFLFVYNISSSLKLKYPQKVSNFLGVVHN